MFVWLGFYEHPYGWTTHDDFLLLVVFLAGQTGFTLALGLFVPRRWGGLFAMSFLHGLFHRYMQNGFTADIGFSRKHEGHHEAGRLGGQKLLGDFSSITMQGRQ